MIYTLITDVKNQVQSDPQLQSDGAIRINHRIRTAPARVPFDNLIKP